MNTVSGIDEFASTLFEQAKRFLEKAKLKDSENYKVPYLNAALLIGVSALEAHINAIADEMLLRRDIDILDISILSEKDFALENGDFIIKEKLKMYRLMDRIEFIYQKFSQVPLDKSANWWRQLNETLRARNSLVHPKEKFILSQKIVESSLLGILEALDTLYLALYHAPYPALGRQLDSNLDF